MKIYFKARAITGKILQIYSDANSCYDIAFKRLGITEQHVMTKSETEFSNPLTFLSLYFLPNSIITTSYQQ